jgi:DNA-binding transcriptional LysR family regulator
LGPFTLRQCSYFLAAAEHGGISQAARALNISQPAVAQALDRLEELVGFPLFERRHARGVVLTVQGRGFLVHARRLLAEAARTEAAARAIAEHRAGEIRFGCFHTLAPFYLAGLVAEYRALVPLVRLVTAELRQDELVASVANGSVDLALTYDMGAIPERFERTAVAELEPYVILPAGHPLAARRSVTLSALSAEPMVLFEGPTSGDYFRTLLRTHDIDPPIAMASTSMESVRSAVGNGLGFSILVMRSASDVSCDGRPLATVRIKDPVARLPVVLLRLAGAPPSALVDVFVRQCRARFATVETRGEPAPARWRAGRGMVKRPSGRSGA